MFISFEGLDGSGKSTQAAHLARRLEGDGRRVVRVREPGGTPLGETIRAILLDPASDIAPRAELLLFSAARAHLVERVIAPALRDGAIVIADRFFDSTTAYQGYGRGVLAPETAETFHALVTGGLAPDLSVLVDVDVPTARQRRVASATDRMEAADDAFFGRVRDGYLSLARLYPDRIAALDGSRSEEELAGIIHRLVQQRLP